MNVTHNISASSPTQTGASAQTPSGADGGAQSGAGTALDQLLAFLSLLTGQETGTGGPAKNTLSTDAGAQGGAAGVNTGATTDADAQKSGRLLTADLSASASAGTQDSSGDAPELVAQLASKFDTLAAAGPVSADALAQFRDNAIGFLKSKGLDESKIDKTLVDLSALLGDKLSTQQAAQLALPAFSWTVAPGPQNSDASLAADDSGSLSVSAKAKGGTPDAPVQAPPQPGGASGAGTGQGHDKGAANGASQDVSNGAPAAGQAPGKTPETNTRGADAARQVNSGSTNTQGSPGDGKSSGIASPNNGNNSGGAPSAPQGANANSLSAAPADGFDGGDGSSGRNFSSGQQSSGGDTGGSPAGVPLVQGALQNGGPALAQNFVNYLSAAPQGQASAMTQMVALQIRHNAAAGTDTFTLQLEPAELGRLDIKLKFDKTGIVTAHVSADKPETLVLLQKDAPQLHRLLQQAGLTAGNNALSFDLRQQGQQQNSGGSGQGGNSPAAASADTGATDTSIQAKLAVASQGYISQSGVNIIV